MIMYRYKMMLSGEWLKKMFNVFGQNVSIENLNSMPSKGRQIFLKIFVLFEGKKV